MSKATHLKLGAAYLEKILQNKPGPAPRTASLSTPIYTENGASLLMLGLIATSLCSAVLQRITFIMQ